jgi:succinoglycan biosynthesis protein ExoA
VVIALGIVVGLLQATGVLSGWWAALASVVYLPVIAYAVLVIVVALGPGGGKGWRDKLWTAAVLPTMHLSWGWGFVIGVLRGAHDTVDTSRLGDRNTPLP